MSESKGCVTCDSPPAVQDFCNAMGWDIEPPREFGSTDAQFLQFFGQMLARVNGVNSDNLSPSGNQRSPRLMYRPCLWPIQKQILLRKIGLLPCPRSMERRVTQSGTLGRKRPAFGPGAARSTRKAGRHDGSSEPVVAPRRHKPLLDTGHLQLTCLRIRESYGTLSRPQLSSVR
jgi:hypothetical protein